MTLIRNRRVPNLWYNGRPAALYAEALARHRPAVTTRPSPAVTTAPRSGRGVADPRRSVALVTGGGRGIGRLVAQALAKADYAVGVVARSPGELAETARLIEDAGAAATAVAADVTDERAAADAVERIQQELGPIDVLINNAGILGPIGPAWEVDLDAWWRTMEVNLFGTLVYTKLVVPTMVRRQRGRIINVTSQAGAFRWPVVSAYSVSKAATIKLTENLALETRRHGITVFSIHPGLLPIGLSEAALDSEADPDSYEGRVVAWAQQELKEGRGADPDQAIEQILRLTSGRYDELSGLHLSVHDDLDEVLGRIDDIRHRELYVLGLQGLAA
jgi:NAD(P)-dependent dehydrogenase (short-subunit alcohol dehydrogenase family)